MSTSSIVALILILFVVIAAYKGARESHKKEIEYPVIQARAFVRKTGNEYEYGLKSLDNGSRIKFGVERSLESAENEILKRLASK